MSWNKLLPQNWNDTLSLFLVVGIPILWLVAKALPESAMGASIVVWTLVAQYYFRRAPSTNGGK